VLGSAMLASPNMRVQRTRTARFARCGSPLTRGSLGSLSTPSTVDQGYGVSGLGRGDLRASSQSEGGRAHIRRENPFLGKQLPNMRVQRTRVLLPAVARRSPLTRRPLGSFCTPSTVNRVHGASRLGRGDLRAR
jgi:hypothetical protein